MACEVASACVYHVSLNVCRGLGIGIFVYFIVLFVFLSMGDVLWWALH